VATARYDAVADFYETYFSDGSDPIVLSLFDLLGPTDGRRVLDLACGHGRISRELARRGASVTGADLSQALVDKAEAIEASAPLAIRYVRADAATADELPDGVFDAAVCNFGLSDIDNLDGALATVHRVLRPGGSFVFSILHPCFPGAETVSGAWPSSGTYHDEGFWVADGSAPVLRRQVGANHRTLSTYVNALSRHGLAVRQMSEPAAPAEWGTDERREAIRYPTFLVAHCGNDGN
jgi:ubiquinone/menaquinone biosynthesis C-methylase UbiE